MSYTVLTCNVTIVAGQLQMSTMEATKMPHCLWVFQDKMPVTDRLLSAGASKPRRPNPLPLQDSQKEAGPAPAPCSAVLSRGPLNPKKETAPPKRCRLFCHGMVRSGSAVSGQLLKYRDHIFRDGAVLLLCSAAHADAAGNPALDKERIAARHQGDPGVIGLDGHERAALGGPAGHILGFGLGDRRGIGLARHQGDAQRQGLAVPAVQPGAGHARRRRQS